MNWVLIIVIVIIAACAIRGMKEGLIKTIFSLFSVLIAIGLAIAISPQLCKTLQNNEKIVSFVESKVSKTIEMAQEREEKEEAEEQEQKEFEEDTEDKHTTELTMIQELFLPSRVKEELVENRNAEVYEAMGVTSFHDYIVRYLAYMIIKAACIVGVYLVASIGLAILAQALDLLSKLPIIHGMNKTAGLAVGIIHGVLSVWILFIILSIFGSTYIAEEMFIQIEANKILTILYENNLIMKYALDIVQTLI